MFAVLLVVKRPVKVCGADVCVAVDAVSQQADLQRGLQGRKELKENQGMFFVFSKDDQYRFWMKDMTFPLDILWLNSKGDIVFVQENAPPCAGDPCAVYAPPQEARYVLEVNAGFSRAHGLRPGVRMAIKK